MKNKMIVFLLLISLIFLGGCTSIFNKSNNGGIAYKFPKRFVDCVNTHIRDYKYSTEAALLVCQ